MDKGSKIVFLTLIILLVISIILTLNRAFITHNFEVISSDQQEDTESASAGNNYPLVEP